MDTRACHWVSIGKQRMCDEPHDIHGVWPVRTRRIHVLCPGQLVDTSLDQQTKDSAVNKLWLEISELISLETSMEGTRQRPMTSRYVLIIGDDAFCRRDKQGDWSDHYLSYLMTCRNAKTSYRLKSIHEHISPFSLILSGTRSGLS
jgi:hypothetical protein